MRVGFAIMDPTGGGAHYRGILPARRLRAMGHEVVVGDQVRFGDEEWRLGIDLREGELIDNPQGLRGPVFVDDAGGEVEAFVPDVLVVTAGWSLGVSEVLEIGRSAGGGSRGRNVSQRLVVDFDDGLDAPADNAGFRPDQLARKVASALEADRLTCSVPAIARDLSAVRRPTFVVRNMIDPTLYADVAAQNRIRLAGSGFGVARLVCGYRGPLPWHLEDVRELRDAASALVGLGCRFVHIGARSTDRETFAGVLGIAEELVERRLQVPFAQYPDQLSGIDVGLVPWARRPWSKYKSNIGALEWTAAGVPWVATDQPEYRRLDGDACVSGRFGWASRVRELTEPRRRAAVLSEQRLAAERYNVGRSSAPASMPAPDSWAHALLGGLE